MSTPEILRVAEVESTNDELAELARAGAADGIALIAERQRAGRGRRGRSWVTLPGRHVALSVLHRPERPVTQLAGLTLDVGTAVAGVLTGLGAEVALKWPNDLLIGGLKVGGILCELIDERAVIIGLGLNVDDVALPPELGHATTLGAQGVAVDHAQLVDELVSAIRRTGRDYERRGAPDVMAWRAYADTIGRRVSRSPAGPEGEVVGIEPDGALMVAWDGGSGPERFLGGELTYIEE